VHMNTVHLKGDKWYLPASSTNRGRMNKTRSCVAGPSSEGQKEWHPAKCYLTVQDLEDIWDAQDRRCGWLNMPLDFGVLHKSDPNYFPKHPLAPSVDRIDDDGDYTKDNVIICCRFANLGRNIYPADRMASLVNLIAENIKPIDEIFEQKSISERGVLPI
jgi:hypothetical protein